MPAPLSIEIRELIAEDLEAGISHEMIADDLDISRSTVSRLAHHINRYGHFFPKPTGSTTILDKSQLKKVKKLILENPNGTITIFADLISKEIVKKKISRSTVYRILVRLGFSFNKNSKKVARYTHMNMNRI